MNVDLTTAEVDPELLRTELDSPCGKLLYLSLVGTDGRTADELGERLDLPKLTVHGVLGTLVDRGLVERDGDRYVARRTR